MSIRLTNVLHGVIGAVSARWLEILALLVILAGLVSANRGLGADLFLTHDFAATSIGTFDARQHWQIYGSPSWNDYYQPGSAWIYFVAPFEAVLSWAGASAVPAKAPLAARIFLDVFVLGVVCFLLGRSLGRVGGRVASLMLLAWSAANPVALISVWEPHVGSIVHLLFVVTCACAATLRPPSTTITLAAGLLGGLALQTQLSFLPTVAMTLSTLLVLVARRDGAGRALRSTVAIAAGGVLGAWPILADLVVRHGQNLRDYLAYSARLAPSGRLPLLRALSVFGESATPAPAMLVVFAMVVALLSLGSGRGTFSSREDNAKQQSAVFILFSCVSLLGGAIFYLVFAKNGYAPPHSGAFTYLVTGVLFASIASCFASQSVAAANRRVATVLLVGAVLALVQVNSLRVPLNGIGYVDSPGFRTALEDVAAHAGTVGIRAVFPKSGVAISPLERDLPWAAAVGFANELRRRDLAYCYAETPENPDLAYADRIMKRFMKTAGCPAGAGLRVYEFSCDSTGLLVRPSGANEYRISGCG